MRSNPLRLLVGNADFVGGIITIAVAGFLFLNARDLPFGTISAPDAGFFPKLLSAILAVAGLGLVARSTFEKEALPEFTARSWAVPIGAAALLLYAALIDRLGFVLCTVAIMFLLMTVYGRLRWAVSLAVSISAVAVCYFCFTELGVPLPQGVLTFF
jgi:hypothetical protein